MPNGLKISEINLLEYLKAFDSLRTPLSDFYLKTKSCRILGAVGENKTPCGLLVTERGTETEILFLSASNDSETVKKALVRYLVKHLPFGTQVRWRTAENSADEKLARAFGFRYENTLHIFRTVDSSDPGVPEVIRENERLAAFAERRGYEARSFRRLTEEEISQICINPRGEFEEQLHPELLMDEKAGGFSPELSFAAVKDGRVAAYTIIRAPDPKHCVFEIVCAAKSEKKTGAFLLPLVSSMKAIRESGAENATFAIYDTNAEALPLVTKRYGALIGAHSLRRHYIYTVSRR